MKAKELIIGCAFLLISCLFFISTFSFPTPPVQAAGPAFWPRVMSVILGLFSIFFIVKSANDIRKEKRSTDIESTKTASNTTEKTSNFKKPLIGMVATVFFIILLYIFGFIIGTFSYFILLTVIVTEKYSWKKFFIAAVQASILVVTIYFLFGEFLNINLPDGILFY